MPRVYSVVFEDVLVSAVQDLVQIKGAAGKILRILRVHWGCTDTTAPTNQQIKTRGRFLPVTVTDGSGGGSAPTPRPFDPGDAAASFTALINSTAKATTTGTATIQFEHGDNIMAGLDMPLRNPTIIGPSESFVFELLSTVSGTVHLSGQVDVEESGG